MLYAMILMITPRNPLNISCLNAVEIFIFAQDYCSLSYTNVRINLEKNYKLSSKNKVLFIFAEMKCNYNNDWDAIYVAMLNFVERVYNTEAH